MGAPCKGEGRLQCRVEEKVSGEVGMTGPDLNARIETYYVRVRGMVQGVGFRHATARRAHELGVSGWVANLPDGSVEAMLQGPANQIDRMLEWMRRGPPSARVTDFASEERAIERRFVRFEQH
jgi:acylphosphatase